MTIRKKLVFWLSYAAGLALLVTIVAVVGVTQKKQGDADKTVTIESTDITPALLRPDGLTDDYLAASPEAVRQCFLRTYLYIGLTPTLFDPATLSYKFRAQFNPCGDNLLYDSLKRIHVIGSLPILQSNISLGIGTKTFTFKSGEIMAVQEWTGIFDDGDLNHYPFDSFNSYQSYITGTYTFRNEANVTEEHDLPVSVAIAGNLQSFKFEVTGSSTNSSQLGLSFDFNVQRAITGKLFSVMIMLIMWILCLLAITMTLTIFSRGRKIEPPIMGVHVALLFAMPGIRNTQPGSPPIGCISDSVSFFWAMSIISVSVMLLFTNYMLNYRKEKKAPESKAQEASAPVASYAAPSSGAYQNNGNFIPSSNATYSRQQGQAYQDASSTYGKRGTSPQASGAENQGQYTQATGENYQNQGQGQYNQASGVNYQNQSYGQYTPASSGVATNYNNNYNQSG